jgi:hypothetical protein
MGQLQNHSARVEHCQPQRRRRGRQPDHEQIVDRRVSPVAAVHAEQVEHRRLDQQGGHDAPDEQAAKGFVEQKGQIEAEAERDKDAERNQRQVQQQQVAITH